MLMLTAGGVTNMAQKPPAAGATTSLEGTSWQLVRFQAGDERTLAPGDRAKYTIAVSAAGRVSMRLDCNRSNGS
jgi:hypothetical protein